MRIAILTREFPPETAWGGIGTFYMHFAKALVAQGHEVEVFCQGTIEEKTESSSGVLVHRVLPRVNVFGETTGGDLGGNEDLGIFATSLAWECFRSVKKRHETHPFDIVEGHEHLGINAYVNLHGLEGCKTVTRYHTPYYSLVSRALVDWPASPLIQKLEKLSIELADYRISSSGFIDDIIVEDFSVPHAEYEVANFTEIGQIECPAYEEKENLIVFVGRLVLEHKRPDLAAEAFAKLSCEFPDWRIEFAGPDMAMGEGSSVWRYCEEKLSGTSRFKYHGVLDRENLYEIYKKAKLILIPSRFESFGLIGIEAMKFGCVPVVGSGTALEETIDDTDLTFENGDLDSLVGVLRRLLSDGDILRTKYSQCPDKALRYSEEIVLSKNIEVFDSVLMSSMTDQPIEKSAEPTGSPYISIVTPSYNQGEFIGETIESIMHQNFGSFEHIVMDGGSSDDTVEVLKKYPHLKWVSEKDAGQTHAINKGLLEARGEIVAYLNSDDVYRPGAFETVTRFFKENPDANFVVGNCEYINEKSEPIGFLKAQYNGFESLLRYWGWDKWQCIPQQSVFIRKSFLAKIGMFDCRYHFVMDLEMWFRVALNGGFAVIDQTLSAFRLAEDTKTVANTHKMYFEEYQAFKRYRKFLSWSDRLKITFEAKRHLSSKLLETSEHLCLSTSKGELPLELLSRAFLVWPLIVFRIRFLLSYFGVLVKGDNWFFGRIKTLHFKYLNYKYKKEQAKQQKQ